MPTIFLHNYFYQEVITSFRIVNNVYQEVITPMNMEMIMSMIPGAADFKRQGLKLIAAANKLTAAVDELAAFYEEGGTRGLGVQANLEAAVFIANAEFKQALAMLPPMPGV